MGKIIKLHLKACLGLREHWVKPAEECLKQEK